jgi:hypothetical protein
MAIDLQRDVATFFPNGMMHRRIRRNPKGVAEDEDIPNP